MCNQEADHQIEYDEMKKNILAILCVLTIAFASCANKKKAQTSFSGSDSASKPQKAVIIDSSYAMIYELRNDSIQVIAGINRIDSLNIFFGLEIKKKEKVESIKGTAALIRLEDENGNKYIPEGTAIDDENQKEHASYFCDSTYSFHSTKTNLGFGFQEETKKRLCLTRRYNNQGLELLTNMYYTLYRKR